MNEWPGKSGRATFAPCTSEAPGTIALEDLPGAGTRDGSKRRYDNTGNDHPMRFSLTMEDSLVEQIDKEARQTGTTRAEWIRTACTDALTTEAPEEPRPDPPELIDLRSRAVYLEQTIADLRADREYLRSEVARLVQENSLLMHRLLPAPKPGAISRFRRWLSGNGEE